MTVYGYLLVATLIGIPWFVRSDRLRDGEGNPTAKPVAWSWVCLVVAAFFFVEFLSKLGDPFHQRNPENYYVMWAFSGFGLLAFFAMRRAHVTIVRAKVVEHMPPFRRREIPLAEIREIRDDGFSLLLRSRDKRRIGLPKAYSGAKGIVEALRASRPDLFKENSP